MRWYGPVSYVAGLMLIGVLQVCRQPSSARQLIWMGVCEWAGFLLVAALLGWAAQQFPAVAIRLQAPGPPRSRPARWYCWAQACLSAVSVALIAWILLDPAFDVYGHGSALLGLAGRLAGCPAALMLLGAAIVMAWQTRDRWRGRWQYAALAQAVLFTSSIGWARLDPAADAPWLRRVTYVCVSLCMMTLLTSVGLARVLPHSGDWLVRARRAAPVFAGLALLLGALALAGWCTL